LNPPLPSDPPPPHPTSANPPQNAVAADALFCKNCLRWFFVTSDSLIEQTDFM